MNFVALFRPLRVVPNTLDPSLNGLDWGVMSKMFSGCLAPASTPGSLVSVMAPPCPLTCHPSVISLPGPSTKYDPGTFSAAGEEHVDTAYSNLIGPSDAADLWGEKGAKKTRMEVLRAWIGSGRRKRLGSTHRRVDRNEDAVLEWETDECGVAAGPSRLASVALRTPKRRAQNDDSGESSDEGGSDDHARTAWKLFRVGEIADACKIWVSPSPQSQSQIRAEVVVDMGTLPTPTSSPLLRGRRLEESKKGKERATEHASQSNRPSTIPLKHPLGRDATEIVLPPVTPDPSRLTSFLSACTSPFVSFEDIWVSGQLQKEQRNEVAGSGSQPFACLENLILPDSSQDLVSSPRPVQHQSQCPQVSRMHWRNISVTKDIDRVGTKRDIENIGEASLSKRRRVDREDLEVKVGGKDGLSELSETGESQHTYSTPLTRTPTIPSVTGVVDMEVSLQPTSSAFEAEDILEAVWRSSPAPAVTMTPTISFPVRKRIDDRASHGSKTISPTAASSPQTGTRPGPVPGLASCSKSAILLLVAERPSTVVRAKTLSAETTNDVSTHTIDMPISPRTAARRAERAVRRRITEKLRLARPDLVVRARPSRGGDASRIERASGSAPPPPFIVASTSTTEFTSPTVGKMETTGGDENGADATQESAKMDWDKSRQLAERVKEALKRGERASEVLPRLTCLERWYAKRA